MGGWLTRFLLCASLRRLIHDMNRSRLFGNLVPCKNTAVLCTGMLRSCSLVRLGPVYQVHSSIQASQQACPQAAVFSGPRGALTPRRQVQSQRSRCGNRMLSSVASEGASAAGLPADEVMESAKCWSNSFTGRVLTPIAKKVSTLHIG